MLGEAEGGAVQLQGDLPLGEIWTLPPERLRPAHLQERDGYGMLLPAAPAAMTLRRC